MSSPSYYASILCKYLLIIGVVATFFIVVFFNLTYISSQYVDSNIFTIKCEETGPKETTTNLSHLMFVLVGSSSAWKHRRTYIESWWRPNVTHGNIFMDVEPSEELWPWSPTFPPFKVNEDLRKLSIYPKLANQVHIRIYRSILETYRLQQDDGVRWYVS